MTKCGRNRIFTHGVYDGTTDFTPWRTEFKVASTIKKNYPTDFTTAHADLSESGVAGIAEGQTINFDFKQNYDTNEKFFTFWGEQLFTTRMARNPTTYLSNGMMVEEASEQPPLYMVYGTGAGTTYYDKELKHPVLVTGANFKTNLFSSFLTPQTTDTQMQLMSEVVSGVVTEPIREVGIANEEILIGRVTPIKPLDMSSGVRISMIISGGGIE